MNLVSVVPGVEHVRLLGRMDPAAVPVALDWTGSGAEVLFRGSDLWAELEATAMHPVMWMAVLADGMPVARFPVEPGVRFYPLVMGMILVVAAIVVLINTLMDVIYILIDPRIARGGKG